MVGWLTDTIGARPGIAFALVAATLACLATLGLRAHTPGSLAGQAGGARRRCQGKVTDATHTEDISPEEISKRLAAMQPERVFGSVRRWFVEGVEVGEVLWSARRGLVSP